MASTASQPQFRYTQPPSKVIHLRNLPWECTEEELIELGKPFGKVVNTKCNVGANQNQAFIEFTDLNQASAMISYYSSSAEPAQVRGKTVYLQYSNRQEIVNNKSTGDVASNVLLVTIEGVQAHDVSIDVLHLAHVRETSSMAAYCIGRIHMCLSPLPCLPPLLKLSLPLPLPLSSIDLGCVLASPLYPFPLALNLQAFFFSRKLAFLYYYGQLIIYAELVSLFNSCPLSVSSFLSYDTGGFLFDRLKMHKSLISCFVYSPQSKCHPYQCYCLMYKVLMILNQPT